MMRYLCFSVLAFLSTFVAFAAKVDSTQQRFDKRFYVGAFIGPGSTTWEGLVPAPENRGAAMNLSTPIRVNEGGAVWGLMTGYEVTPYFALEASYSRYPGATVEFDPDSLFAFDHDGITEFKTRTETLSLLAKIMMVIPDTSVRLYSGAGVSSIKRKDFVAEDWIFSPTFSVGANYHFNERLMGEIGANYTAGYAESELTPVNKYIPFLYSVYFKLAYFIC